MPFLRSLATVAVLALIGSAPAAAQTLHLTRDVRDVPNDLFSAVELQSVEWNGWIYFAADGADVGSELHRVPVGGGAVERVADLAPGADGAWIDRLTPAGDRLYFIASDGVHGRELWRSDGTATGTTMVADLRPGPVGSVTNNPERRGPFVLLGGKAWFVADDGASGPSLWRSDGTTAGTARVTGAGTSVSGEVLYDVVAMGGAIYATTKDALLRVDPATDAVQVLADTGYATGLTAVGDRVYYSHYLTGAGSEVWVTDGTPAGTLQVSDIAPGGGSSAPAHFTGLGSEVLFIAWNWDYGRELWKTGGTLASTTLVADLWPGSEGQTLIGFSRSMAPLGSTLLFFAEDPSGGRLWRTDGTPAGTAPVVPDAGGPELLGYHAVDDRAVAGSRFYFPAEDPSGGEELWVTDGSAVGTARVADLWPGPASSRPRAIVGSADGSARFVADLPSGPTFLHVTAAGVVTTLATAPTTALPVTQDSEPLGVTAMQGKVLFTARDTTVGYEPMVSDGTPAGTIVLADIAPGTGPAFKFGDPEIWQIAGFPAHVVGSRTFFAAMPQFFFFDELWVTDGSVAGTHYVRDFAAIAGYGDGELRGAALGDRLVFAAQDNGRWGIWISDGTAAGTAELFASAAADLSSMVAAALGDRVLFTVEAPTQGLYVTDGTPGVPELLLAGAGIDAIVAVGDRAYFTADAGGAGQELWVTDGTAAGTALVTDLAPGPASSAPRSLTRVGDRVAFFADDGATGRELWITDGSSAGTTLAVDAVPGAGGTLDSDLAARGEVVTFEIRPTDDTAELWRFEAGVATRRLQVQSTVSWNAPRVRSLTPVGSRRVYFDLQGEAVGMGTPIGAYQLGELWATDGTAAGTAPVDDHRPGLSGSVVGELVATGGKLFLSVDDATRGVELHVHHPGATAMPIEPGCAQAGTAPVLLATDPALGGSTAITIGQGPSLAAGALLLSFAGATAQNLSGGCYAYLGPDAVAIAAVMTDAAGDWSAAPAPIPADPVLSGLGLVIQAVVGPTATAPLGFDLTNGVLLTLGS